MTDESASPLARGSALPPGPDHAFVMESLEQQHAFLPDGSAGSTWTARMRCVHCGVRVAFDACGVPPCRPRGDG